MTGRSLRSRVMLYGVVSMALVLGIGAWLTVRGLSAAQRSDTTAQNNAVLDDLAGQIADGEDPRGIPLPAFADGTGFFILDEEGRLLNDSLFAASAQGPVEVVFVGEFPADFPDDFAEVVGDAGFVTIEETPLPPGVVINADGVPVDADGVPVEAEELAFEPVVEVSPFQFDGSDWLETTRTIRSPTNEEFTLVAFSPVALLDRSVNRLSIALAVIVPALVVLGGLALWFAMGAALKPVRRIAEEANRIAPSNSGGRLPVPESGDEIAQLTVTLNNMLDRLDDGLTRQRQFVADASHELRSPLSTIKGAGGLLTLDPTNVATHAELIQRGSERLESVLDDLTQLVDSSDVIERIETDLEDLVLDEVEHLADQGLDVSIDVAGLSPIVVNGHEVQIRRAVNNLLANAARHAASKVVVASRVTSDAIELVVDDDGNGVAPEDRERIFERFVRLDEGRSRADGGSGLGLAIVASIAAAHGGSVRCEQSPLGGARFTLTLAT